MEHKSKVSHTCRTFRLKLSQHEVRVIKGGFPKQECLKQNQMEGGAMKSAVQVVDRFQQFNTLVGHQYILVNQLFERKADIFNTLFSFHIHFIYVSWWGVIKGNNKSHLLKWLVDRWVYFKAVIYLVHFTYYVISSSTEHYKISCLLLK